MPETPPGTLSRARDLPTGKPFALLGRLVLGHAEAGSAEAGSRDELAAGAIVVDQGKIVEVQSPPVPARLPAHRLEGAFVAPGFVDAQVNGGFGFEVGADVEALRALASALPRTGVTSFLPTLISARGSTYAAAFAAFAAVRAEQSTVAASAAGAAGRGVGVAARMEGLHLEGPLLSSARAGAHDRDAIESADSALVARLADPAVVRLMTVAPERAGALALIAELKQRGICVALGHTDSTFEIFTAGIDAGATVATHLFNAMSPFHHRAPGATGAALTDDRITAFVIADGVHAHPAAFRLAARAKGGERLGLVTDAIAGAGLAPGPTRLGGQEVTVNAGAARLGDGRLAGSILTMDRAVRNAVAFAELSPATAIQLATGVPARVLGLPRRGRLVLGAAADLVLLDDELQVKATFVGGALAYEQVS